MRRLALAAASIALSFASLPFLAPREIHAGGPFETKLSPDRQIVHSLNRLTFGPCPGDVENVRRIGLEKWIDLQLHPDRIPENPVLEAKLEPLETLRMDPATVVRDYMQPQMQMATMSQPANVMNSLPQEERRKVMNGTAEERKAALESFDPEKRKQVLLTLPQTNLASIPEFQKEADEARKEQQEKRQQEMRLRNPTLNDLLDFDQIRIAMSGTSDQVKELLNSFEPERRRQVAAAMPQPRLADLPELRREAMRQRQPQQLVSSDLRAGKLLSAVYSNRQLEEVLVDFWFNHFNVYENKTVINAGNAGNSYRALLASYERDAIRPHVLGHFKDLLLAVARHPAMLYYLDNWQSMSPDADDRMQVGPFARPFNLVQAPQVVNRQPHGLNENYGRELMELHTMGVNGGFTQNDVIEVARCFTGWTVHKPSDPEFMFTEFMHDEGEKTVLGHKIAANGGEKDGLQVIDILSRHPSTARFISRQLAQRFVADDPPAALVERMAQTYLKTDGDLRAVLQTMFASTEFFSEGAMQAKIKSPFEMVVSAVRATGADAIDTNALNQKISDLGEPLYGKVEPNGYPLTGDSWLGTADLLGRLSFASALVAGQVPGVKVDASRWDGKDASAIARDLLGSDAATETLSAIGGEMPPKSVAALIIGSPEFNRR
jgi:uncharacterized protein (DUF1800 family)